MAITYPRPLPLYSLSECTFSLMEGVVSSASARGKRINRTQTADPVWKLRAATSRLDRDQRGQWSGWKKSLRGGLRTFIAYDHSKWPPRAYPNARLSTDVSGGWDGTADVTALGLAGALSLSGLPATYQAKVGDHVGLEEGGHYGLYEVLEDVTAVAGVATLTVAPFLHTEIFTTAAVARLWQPVAKFVLDWQSWEEQAVVEDSSISFEAFQEI